MTSLRIAATAYTLYRSLFLVLVIAIAFISSCSTMNAYAKALRQLYAMNEKNPVKLGLATSRKLYELLGMPLDRMLVVHVGGTNGKGSVSLKTAEMLRRGGLNTGLFVSPHISSFRERIQINGKDISESEVSRCLPELFEMCEKNGLPATFFELTTALAFMQFKAAKCEAVVLEVGLGGRLDSTNVVTPTISAITSVQLDHMNVLGDTIEKIAKEKAGIMKPGVPVIIGPGCPMDVMKSEAQTRGATFLTIDSVLKESERESKPDVNGNIGDVEALNKDISKSILRVLQQGPLTISNSDVQKYISRINLSDNELAVALSQRPSCRFQVLDKAVTSLSGEKRNVTVVLDIAHNEAAIAAFAEKVKATYQNTNIRIVFGMCSDKDVKKCLPHVVSLTALENIHCVAAQHPRATPPSVLRSYLIEAATETRKASSTKNWDFQDSSSSVSVALKNCLAKAADEENSVVLIFGTAFIMSEARAELGIVEPRDSVFLNNTGSRDVQEIFASGKLEKQKKTLRE